MIIYIMVRIFVFCQTYGAFSCNHFFFAFSCVQFSFMKGRCTLFRSWGSSVNVPDATTVILFSSQIFFKVEDGINLTDERKFKSTIVHKVEKNMCIFFLDSKLDLKFLLCFYFCLWDGQFLQRYSQAMPGPGIRVTHVYQMMSSFFEFETLYLLSFFASISAINLFMRLSYSFHKSIKLQKYWVSNIYQFYQLNTPPYLQFW